MSVSNKTQNELITPFAGVGTMAGGAAGYCAINRHYNKIAAKTVQMFDGTLNKPDVFMKKNGKILTDAANSTKGFFGKINKSIGGNSTTSNWIEKIQQGAAEVVTEYRNKAAKSLNGSGLSGKELEDGIKKLSNGKIAKDIVKSIKSASKNKTIAVVLGAAVAGTLLFNAVAKSFKKPDACECDCNTPQMKKKNKAKAVSDDKKIKNDA